MEIGSRKIKPIVSTHDMQEIALGLCVALNVNLILWGPPGAGKTSVMKSIARANMLHLETILVSSKEPTDIAGIPYVSEGREQTAPPEFVRKVMMAAKGNEKISARHSIVFWDEFSTGLPAVQASALTTILDRKAGPFQMPLQTRMIAAANPPKVAANGWDLSAPTANRFVHIDWTLDATTIANGFQQGWKAPAVPRITVDAKTMKNLIRNAEILVGAFIRSKPESVEFDFASFRGNASADQFRASDNAFPTARSWETAAKIYAGANASILPDGGKIPDEVIQLLLEGTVGVAMAFEFMQYARALDLPDPIEALNKPDAFDLPKKNDQTSALLASIQQQALASRSHHRFDLIWSNWGDILCRTLDNGLGDIALPFAKTWQDSMPENSGYSDRHEKSLSALLDAFGE